jgi:hypothetical protein
MYMPSRTTTPKARIDYLIDNIHSKHTERFKLREPATAWTSRSQQTNAIHGDMKLREVSRKQGSTLAKHSLPAYPVDVPADKERMLHAVGLRDDLTKERDEAR